MDFGNKTFYLSELPEALEEELTRIIRLAKGTIAYHLDGDTDILVYLPGEGEKSSAYRRAKDARAHGHGPVLMTPALLQMAAGQTGFDQVPRSEKLAAAYGYMLGEEIWAGHGAEIERFLKYEHESILDRAFIKGETEYIYTMFKWLDTVSGLWTGEGYSDERYLPDLVKAYAQRAIDEDDQDLTSYLLDFKENLGNPRSGDPFADFLLEDEGTSDEKLAEADRSLPVYYSCGKHLELGQFKASAGGAPGKIRWMVVSREEDRALLLACDVLEILPFNDVYENTSWENCSLRQWLDEEFYETAFTEAEKEKILPARIKNGKADGVHGTIPEDIYRDTFDRVFLLSADEVKYYLTGSSAIKAGATDYVKAQDVPSAIGGRYRWWGRSMGINGSNACVVDYSWVNGYGENVNSGGIGVRPAMWIKVD